MRRTLTSRGGIHAAATTFPRLPALGLGRRNAVYTRIGDDDVIHLDCVAVGAGRAEAVHAEAVRAAGGVEGDVAQVVDGMSPAFTAGKLAHTRRVDVALQALALDALVGPLDLLLAPEGP
ncbi:MAG TPA: hypothetical protein RMH99_10640, partial [Sandaracinaceae bacterium LLY-WYZ-13_1]|nr:hypothetical protein [Sandaracinaceae bacterium LLY-WYZ-13_1]